MSRRVKRLAINWRTVRPEALPEGSAVRQALEDGRPDVAAWLAETYPAGGPVYIHSDATHRRLIWGERVRAFVREGFWTASWAARRFGLNRNWLSQDGD